MRLIEGVWHMRVVCRTPYSADRVHELFPETIRDVGTHRVVWTPMTEAVRIARLSWDQGYVSSHVYGVVKERAAEWAAYGIHIGEKSE